MIIGLENRDRSYFKATYKNQKEGFQDVTKDIISFNVTEETGRIMSGSISFYDKNYKYHDTFRIGKPIDLEWGYTRPNVIFGLNDDPEQLKGAYKRTNIQARIQSPSGGGTEQGVKTYNCNFIGREFIGAGIRTRMYKQGNKASVVDEVLKRLGCTKTYVNFNRGKEKITAYTYVMQWESDWKFLRRISFEWGAIFSIGITGDGTKVGLFANQNTMEYNLFVNMKTQAVSGSLMIFNYMNLLDDSSTTLVKNFTWSQEGGAGDNVQISMVGGQVQILRYNAETEKTIVYKMDTAKMSRVIKDAVSSGNAAQVVGDMLSVNSFESLIEEKEGSKGSGFFYPVTQTTAPQGLGFKLNLKCIGNPMLTAPCRAKFESSSDKTINFPPIFTNDKLSWWIRRVNHTISNSGYECDVEIVDGFTASGGSYVH